MASTLATVDPPRLSLVIDKPPSSSPFPSPGSSFLPPPQPGAHEFASRPPSRNWALQKKKGGESATTDLEFQAQDTFIISQLEPSSTLSLRDSLTSSRPAPPSPSPSCRASAVISPRSSSPRAGSRNLSRNPSTKRQSKLQHEIQLVPPASLTESSPDSASRRRALLANIRDFAYPFTDDRHFGNGPDAPKSNRYAESSDGSLDGADDIWTDSEKRHSGWGGFMWAGLTNRLSWSFGAGRTMFEGSDTPSKVDFERNFDVSSPMDEKECLGELNTAYGESEGAGDDGEDDEQKDGCILPPGRYRAMYSFEPEGTAEMALEEDQIVCVVGRGGGVGWAVVEKVEGGYALVPESYLELVETQ